MARGHDIPSVDAIAIVQGELMGTFFRTFERHFPLLEKLHGQVRELQARLDVAQAERDTSREQTLEATRQLKETETKLAEKTGAINYATEDWKRRADEWETRRGELQQHVASLESQLRDATAARTLLNEENDKLRISLRSCTSELLSSAKPRSELRPQPMVEATPSMSPESIQATELEVTNDAEDAEAMEHDLNPEYIPKHSPRAELWHEELLDVDLSSPPPSPQAIPDAAIQATKDKLLEYDAKHASTLRTDMRLIWDFIRSVKTDSHRTMLQMVLLEAFPTHVTDGVEDQWKNTYRFITISKGLTWPEAKRAFDVLF